MSEREREKFRRSSFFLHLPLILLISSSPANQRGIQQRASTCRPRRASGKRGWEEEKIEDKMREESVVDEERENEKMKKTKKNETFSLTSTRQVTTPFSLALMR